MKSLVIFWKEHSLSIVLIAIFAVMCIGTWPMGDAMWDHEGSYLRFWVVQTLWSLEADVFGAILLVIFTKYLREKDSAQSRESRKPVALADGDVLEITMMGTVNELNAAEQLLTAKFVEGNQMVLDALDHSRPGVVKLRFVNEIERNARVAKSGASV